MNPRKQKEKRQRTGFRVKRKYERSYFYCGYLEKFRFFTVRFLETEWGMEGRGELVMMVLGFVEGKVVLRVDKLRVL